MSLAYLDPLAHLLIAETRRRLLGESFVRMRSCLYLLSEAEIWHRPNPSSNSAGNLVLHVCGNVRQWLLATLGGAPDQRQRQAEFDERGPIAREVLLTQLEALSAECEALLESLDPALLTELHPVQGFTESGAAILIHVTEHAAYHCGQITYIVKMLKDLDTGYYAGQDLGITT